MGNVTSTLTMRLIDGISPIAPRVDRSLKGLDAAARKTAMLRHLAAGGAIGRGGVLLAGGIGSSLMGAAAGYVSGRTAIDAYRRYADYDREITRILITAEATGAEAVKTRAVIRDIARETALPIAAVTAGLDTLVASGRSLPDALAFLPSVSKTAQAAGADVIDIAKSADALGVSLKIPADRMEEAFDKMAKAGKLGKFELKDMAQSLPSLLPLAAMKGFHGMEGLEKVVSYLQMIRQGTGSSEEAADSFRDMLAKITSSETVNKFKKFGIDIKKELADVRKAGGNEFDAMFGAGGLLEKALKKGAQTSDLFQDIQAMRGALAYVNALADRQKYLNEVQSAAGTVNADLARLMNDAAAASQRLGNAWDNTLKSFGNLGDAVGVTKLLEKMAENNMRGAEAMERFVAALREGKSISDAIRAGNGSKTDQETLDQFDRDMTTSGGFWNPQPGVTRSEYADRMERSAAARAATAAAERKREALRVVQELATKRAMNGGHLGMVDTDREAGAVADILSDDERRAAQALIDLSNKGLDSRAEDIAHAARRGPVAVPSAPPQSFPLPVPRPDYQPAIEAARRAAAEIRAAFETINPTIRPQIVMPEIPSSSSLLRKIHGSYGDDNGRR